MIDSSADSVTSTDGDGRTEVGMVDRGVVIRHPG